MKNEVKNMLTSRKYGGYNLLTNNLQNVSSNKELGN